jgi:integrase
MMAARRLKGDGSIYFEADRNRWVGTVDLPDDGTGERRRTKVTGRTKTEVRERLRARQQLVEQSVPSGAGDLTVEALLRRWIDEVLPSRSSVSPNTVASYRWAVERHLIPRLGKKRLRALTPDHVERVLRRLADDGMARHTLVRIRSVLGMAIKWAQRRDLVARNVAELADIPANAARPKGGRSLTVEEARQLLETASEDRLGPLVTVSLMLGLRPGEVTGLRWIDVDLDAAIVHVRQARKREMGEDGIETLTFGRPKTPKSVRSIEVPSPVVSSLRRQQTVQDIEPVRGGRSTGSCSRRPSVHRSGPTTSVATLAS